MGELALVRHGGDGRAAQLSDWARVDPLRNVRLQPRDGVFAEPPAFRELAGQLQTIDCHAISVTPLPSGVPSIRTNGKCGALINLKRNAARTPSNVSAPNMKHTTRSRIASNTNTGRLRPRPRAGGAQRRVGTLKPKDCAPRWPSAEYRGVLTM